MDRHDDAKSRFSEFFECAYQRMTYKLHICTHVNNTCMCMYIYIHIITYKPTVTCGVGMTMPEEATLQAEQHRNCNSRSGRATDFSLLPGF